MRGALAQPLAGKAALVTGASSGIGAATALALAREGAAVGLVARRIDRLEALRARLADEGASAVVLPADLAREADAHAVVERAVDALGRLDIVVNGAGVMLLAPAADATATEWRRMLELNLLALMVVTHAALPHLRAVGGHLVNIASLAGRVANPNASGYAASKFGVVGFSEAVRREVYADRVRVTVVEPGIVATELGDHIEHPAMKANLEARLAQLDPLQAEDIAAAVAFAVTRPAHVGINEIVVRPTRQER
jgi:NADP-dependent 3-hydroxy acid dehydrogenase YdfG